MSKHSIIKPGSHSGWFQHDTTASRHPDMQHLLLDQGLEGYGLYWLAIELQVANDGILEHSPRMLARMGGMQANRVISILTPLIEKGHFNVTNRAEWIVDLARRV